MDEYDISFEPMDVDISARSSSGMDISYNDSEGVSNEVEDYLKKMSMTIKSEPADTGYEDTVQPSQTEFNTTQPKITPNIKKFHISMPKGKLSPQSWPTVKVLCAALVILISVVAYQVLNVQCSEDIKIDDLKKSLISKLYGQDEAIDSLIQGLSETQRSKILIIYGSTGVGKTLAGSTLLEHLGRYSNVYHYTMPSFVDTFTTDFMAGLTVCKNSFIIVDDLSLTDLKVKDHINNLLAKTNSLEKSVTILLIYKCNLAQDFKRHCDESMPTQINDKLKPIMAYRRLIPFKTLTEEHLRKCIETELGSRKITDVEFTKIMKNFDVAVDGCKGVHRKIKLMGIS